MESARRSTLPVFSMNATFATYVATLTTYIISKLPDGTEAERRVLVRYRKSYQALATAALARLTNADALVVVNAAWRANCWDAAADIGDPEWIYIKDTLYRSLQSSTYNTPAANDQLKTEDGYELLLKLYNRVEPPGPAAAERYRRILSSQESKYEDGVDMQQHCDRIIAVIEQLNSVETTAESAQVRLLLNTIPKNEHWSAFTMIQESNGALTLELLSSNLINHVSSSSYTGHIEMVNAAKATRRLRTVTRPCQFCNNMHLDYQCPLYKETVQKLKDDCKAKHGHAGGTFRKRTVGRNFKPPAAANIAPSDNPDHIDPNQLMVDHFSANDMGDIMEMEYEEEIPAVCADDQFEEAYYASTDDPDPVHPELVSNPNSIGFLHPSIVTSDVSDLFIGDSKREQEDLTPNLVSVGNSKISQNLTHSSANGRKLKFPQKSSAEQAHLDLSQFDHRGLVSDVVSDPNPMDSAKNAIKDTYSGTSANPTGSPYYITQKAADILTGVMIVLIMAGMAYGASVLISLGQTGMSLTEYAGNLHIQSPHAFFSLFTMVLVAMVSMFHAELRSICNPMVGVLFTYLAYSWSLVKSVKPGTYMGICMGLCIIYCGLQKANAEMSLAAHSIHDDAPTQMISYVMDSGCTTAITTVLSAFSTMHSVNTRVKTGDGVITTATAAGSVIGTVAHAKNATVVDIQSLYMPTFAYNLLSTHQLNSQGYQVVFGPHNCGGSFLRQSSTGSQIPLRKASKLHYLDLQVVPSTLLDPHMACTTTALQYHRRLGHLNFSSLLNLAKRKLLPGLKAEDVDRHTFCDACVQGKAKVAKFSKASTRASKPLGRVSTDFAGRFPVKSIHGHHYYQVFIDQFTGYKTVHTTDTTSSALTNLKSFCAYVGIPKVLRLDNDPVFTAHKFKNFCNDKLVKLEYCQPYRHQQNGAAERSIQYINSMARVMLIAAKLSDKFWAHAVKYAVFVQNRVPPQTENSKLRTKATLSPIHKLTGKKADLSLVQEFGCPIYYMLRDADVRHKFKKRAEKGIFLGYSEDTGSPSALVYTPKGKVLKVREVWFKPPVATEANPTPDLLLPEEGKPAKKSATPAPPQFHTPHKRNPQRLSTTSMRFLDEEDAAPPTPSHGVAQNNGANPNNHMSPTPSPSQTPPGTPPAHSEASPIPESYVDIDMFDMDSYPLPGSVGAGSVGDSVSSPQAGPSQVRSRQPPDQFQPHTSGMESSATKFDGRAVPYYEALNAEVSNRHRSMAEWENLTWVLAGTEGVEPKTYKEATNPNSPDKVLWEQSMKSEMASMEDKNVFTVIPDAELPKDAKVIPSHWVYKIKPAINDTPPRYKSRWVANGNKQDKNGEYEVFAPVARFTTIRLLFTLAVSMGLPMHVVDVSTAFLNAELPKSEQVFLRLPPGYTDPSGATVCRVEKCIYGLRQSPRQWNLMAHKFLTDQGFTQSEVEPCLYFNTQGGAPQFVALYVDDFAIVGNPTQVAKFKKAIAADFKVTDHGEVSLYCGLQFTRNFEDKTGEILMTDYIDKVVKTFKPKDTDPVGKKKTAGCDLKTEDWKSNTPYDPSDPIISEPSDDADTLTGSDYPYRSLVASLLWVSNMARPDITFVVKKLTYQFNSNTKNHFRQGLRVLKYLNKTRSIGIKVNGSSSPLQLYVYSDSDYAADAVTRKSTSGGISMLGLTPLSWYTKAQKSVAVSTMEAEYMALCEATKEAKYLQHLLLELDLKNVLARPAIIYEDNEAARLVSKDPKHFSRAKHIAVQYHFSRFEQKAGNTEVRQCTTHSMYADYLTKYLPESTLTKLHQASVGYTQPLNPNPSKATMNEKAQNEEP